MLQKVKEFLDRTLPGAKYSDGRESECIDYRLYNMVDIADD